MLGENEKSQTLTRNCPNSSVKDNKTCSINILESKGGLRRVLIFYWLHGGVVTQWQAEEKTEVLHALFASVCSSKTSCSLGAELPELEEREGEQNEAPVIQE